MSPTRNAPVWATILLTILGIALAVVTVGYFAEPAGKLLAAVVALAAAWLSTGRKRTA